MVENTSLGNVTVANGSASASEKVFLADMQIVTDALFGTVATPTVAIIHIQIVGEDSFWTYVENGAFGMDTTPYPHGTYDVYVTAPNCLRRKYQWAFQAGDVTGIQVNLPFGDLNQDGSITADEASVILGYLEKTPNDIEWFDVVDIGGTKWMAGHFDFNRDGVINSDDYNMVAPNVGLVSD